MHRFHTKLQTTLTAIIQLLGLWTLLAQICVLTGTSYTTLRTLSVLPVIIFIGVQNIGLSTFTVNFYIISIASRKLVNMLP